MGSLVLMTKFVKLWRAELDEHTIINPILIFLYIALNPECTSKEIERATGISQSTISRHCMALSSLKSPGVPGYGLIDETYDPSERRRKIYFLTEKGAQFVKRIEAFASEALSPHKVSFVPETKKVVAYSSDKIFEVDTFLEGVKIVSQDDFWEAIHYNDPKEIIGAEIDSCLYDEIKFEYGILSSFHRMPEDIVEDSDFV